MPLGAAGALLVAGRFVAGARVAAVRGEIRLPHQLAPLLRGVRLREGRRLLGARGPQGDGHPGAAQETAAVFGQRPGVTAVACGNPSGARAAVPDRDGHD